MLRWLSKIFGITKKSEIEGKFVLRGSDLVLVLNRTIKHKSMQVDVTFSNAKVYDINRIDVKLGEKFFLTTNGDGSEDLFSDNDPVLDITTNGTQVSLTASKVGMSRLKWINTAGTGVIKDVVITVMDNILPPASDLGLTADSAIPK